MKLAVREYGEWKDSPTQEVAFAVKKEILIKSCKYFEVMLSSGWKESTARTIFLEGDNATAVELWLRRFHANPDEKIDCETASFADVWHVIIVADKYCFELNRMKDWFVAWFLLKNPGSEKGFALNSAPYMLFPCYAFDYADGFQLVTKRLAYNGAHFIQEQNPTDIPQMHVPQRIIREYHYSQQYIRTDGD